MSIAVPLESSGVPWAGHCSTTSPAPRTRAVYPSRASTRSASRALRPVRSGSADKEAVPANVTTDVEAIGRLISLALRSGIPMPEIYRQLRGISSDRVVGLGPNKVLSVPDAIGIAIEKWLQEKQGIQQELLAEPGSGVPAREVVGDAGAALQYRGAPAQEFIGACPDCGSQLAFIEGCAKCHVCGYSECG